VIGVVMVLFPMLAGCVNPGSVVEGVVEQATGGDVDLGGDSIPEDFPLDEVPLIDGDVLFGARVNADGGSAWNVTISTVDPNALQTVSTQMADAGFDQQEASMVGDDGAGFATFAKGELGVAVVVTKSDDGIAVNYTVTAGG